MKRGVAYALVSAAIFFGGVVGPVLLMRGLVVSPASTASLLLNLEAVFTALAYFLFRENFDRQHRAGDAVHRRRWRLSVVGA